MSNADLLTVSSYAKKMGVTTSYLYKLFKDGRIVPEIVDGVKFVDLGKHPEIPKAEKK